MGDPDRRKRVGRWASALGETVSVILEEGRQLQEAGLLELNIAAVPPLDSPTTVQLAARALAWADEPMLAAEITDLVRELPGGMGVSVAEVRAALQTNNAFVRRQHARTNWADMPELFGNGEMTVSTRDHGCLYCLSDEGPFEAREHIFPESLGNTSLILPEGLVCRPCNNWPLSRWERELLEFAPIALSRITKGIPTKAGKLPNKNFANMRARSIASGEIAFEHHDKKSFEFDRAKLFQHVRHGPADDSEDVSDLTRALFKIVLGLIYLDPGPTAFDARFDGIRSVVKGEPFKGYLLLKNKAVPTDDVKFSC